MLAWLRLLALDGDLRPRRAENPPRLGLVALGGQRRGDLAGRAASRAELPDAGQGGLLDWLGDQFPAFGPVAVGKGSDVARLPVGGITAGARTGWLGA
jgi:hypothetical protein